MFGFISRTEVSEAQCLYGKNPGILAYARVLNCSNGFTV